MRFRLLTVLVLLFLACGDDTPNPDGGLVDSATRDAATVPDTEAAQDSEVPDAEAQDAVVTVPGLPFCLEIEDQTMNGEARVWPAHSTTAGGVVILGEDNSGRVTLEFSLESSATIALWARVRAPTHANNSVFVGLEELAETPTDEARWDIPITPVLSWQRIVLRGSGEEWRPEDESWPRTLAPGVHRLIIAGREPSVELDALCVMPADARPMPRYAAPPEHDALLDLDGFGITGDGETDDTAAIQAALDAFEGGQTLRLPAGRFRVTDALRVSSSNVTLEGTLDGEERLSTVYFDHPPRSPSGSTGGIVVVGGGHGTPSPLLEDALPLSRTLVVDSAAEFAVGDSVVVDSDPWGPDNPDLVNVGREPSESFRFLHAHAVIRERAEDGGQATLVLDRPLLESFTREHGSRVSRSNLREGVVIRGLRLEGTQRQLGDDDMEWTDEERNRNAFIESVRMRRVARSFVYNNEILHFRGRGVFLNDNFEIQVFDNDVHDSTDFISGGSGLHAQQSQAVDIYRNHLHGVMRHSISFSDGTSESTITDNDIARGTHESEPGPNHVWACIDIHGEYSYGLLIARNRTFQGEYGVILGGGFDSHGNDGRWIVVRDNTAEGHFGGGIGVNDNTPDAVFEGNHLINNRRGVHIFIKSDRTYVWNNTIEMSAATGILVEDSDATQIIGNIISGDSPAMTLDAACDDYLIRGNDVGGGEIIEPGNGTVD